MSDYNEHLISMAGGDGEAFPASREITVEQENPMWLEYDREIVVELCHNDHQSTSLKLSRKEARELRDELAYFLERTAS